jgi:hypothetical protein
MTMSQVKASDAYKPEYTILGIALAGVHAKARSQWGECSITMYDNRLFPYLGNLLEGGTVIDKRSCKEEDIVQWVIKGPMLKESLPAGHKDGLWGTGPIKCEDPKSCSSMDYIALDLYVKLWSDMGARVGTRQGNYIVWNDGEVQTIPSVESRWQQER